MAKELLDVATSRKHRSGHNYSAVALLKFLKCVKLNPCPRKRPKPAEVEQLSFSNLNFPSDIETHVFVECSLSISPRLGIRSTIAQAFVFGTHVIILQNRACFRSAISFPDPVEEFPLNK